MEIKILQGVNFENNTTTIKIVLDVPVEEKIIEEISSFHPIFLKAYKIKDGNHLEIQSKLPHLWKEIAKALNEDITYEEKRDFILNTAIKRQVKSMSTISLLQAADEMQEEITQFLVAEGILTNYGEVKYNRQYTIGCGERAGTTISFSSSKDSKEAKHIQEDKYLTNKLIERLNMPIAPWEVIKSEDHLREIFKNYEKPVVVKPASLTAGHGVQTNIHNIEQAISAYKNAQEIISNVTSQAQRNKIIIQHQVQGEDYRLLVINGTLEVATKRVPAFVEGDGKSTIEELIETTNKDPRRNLENPTHTLKPINIDKPLIDYLAEQGLDINYIPKNNEKVNVRKVASMSQGGITIDYTDKVHKHIKYVTESIARSINAFTLGIDVMCKDISKPLTIENGSIIEVNTMPEAYLNLFPVIGRKRPEVAERFIQGLLGNKPETKKIVVIGGDEKNQPKTEPNTGIYFNNSIKINDEMINQNIQTWKAVESLKINAYLNTIILHYKTLEEALDYGLGFDKIDELHFHKSFENEVKNLDKNLIKKYEVFNN